MNNKRRLKFKTLTILLVISLPVTSFFSMAQDRSADLVEHSTLTGNLYYWQRDRDRKNAKTGRYQLDLKHATIGLGLDFSSGYWQDLIGFDLAGIGVVEPSASGPDNPNEVGFSNAKTLWRDIDQGFTGNSNGASIYKAALKLKVGSYWAKLGYIQPTGQTLIDVETSFGPSTPGTYRGAEIGGIFDYGKAGELSVSYFWADRYKAPWYKNLYDFRQMDAKTGVDYLHSLGAKYDFKNSFVLESAYGQAQGFMNQYFAKASYEIALTADNTLNVSYQFYGARDRGHNKGINNVYSGLAWLQALTFDYTTGPVKWNLEGTWTRARGSLGYFVYRMTTSNDSASGGRYDLDWDARSDFNANGEKALYVGALYDFSKHNLPGWQAGSAYVYAWNAKPNNDPQFDQSRRLKESALTIDIFYTIQEGRAKNTQFQLHYTRYKNHSDIPTYKGGYANIFQSEKEISFMLTAPFTLF